MSINIKLLNFLFDKENSGLYKTPNQKIILLIVSFIFFLVAWLNKTSIETKRLQYKSEVILDKTPRYEKRYGKNHDQWIELKFKYNDSVYRIDGYIYETLDHNKFKNDIRKNDTLRIGVLENDIYSLVKNDYEYCNIEGASKSKSVYICFLRIITIVSITVLLLLKGLEKTKVNSSWDIIWIAAIALTAMVLLLK